LNPYTITDIASIVGGNLIQSPEPLHEHSESFITRLLIDSRKLNIADGTLFFAIKGERHDAHDFIPDLIAKGVRNFVVSSIPNPQSLIPNPQSSNFILVEDTLHALQMLGAYHRSRFRIPVIGITGSNGKTIIKEWLYQLMREDQTIVRNPKSFNSQVGVPLSVWQMNEEHTFGIFEAGISKPGEMQQLAAIIQPTIGLFTNIGDAHNEHFLDHRQKVNEKLYLFEHVEALIYCKDYALIHEEVQKMGEGGLKTLTWSRKGKAELQVGRITKEENETEIQAVYNNDFISIRIPFIDDAAIENAIHCWMLMLYFGYVQDVIARRMAMLSPVAMRLELKEGINNCSIINDSYNSDLGSLTIALDFLEQQKQHPKKTLILSDILQSGKNEDNLYREVAELVNKKSIDRLIGIGEAITRQQVQFTIPKSFYASTEQFLNGFNTGTFANETILLKGARTFGFEQISKVIQQKAHETVLEINLNAIVHNLNYFRSRLLPGTKIMAMVKAFSYGSGSFEIASVLQFHRIDYLAVAYADEGVELRKGGITMPIMVMNPEEQSYDAMIQHNLEPEIYSFRVLGLFDDAVKRNADLNKRPFPIHIKLDTGMHRLGFEEHDLNELMVRVKNNKRLYIKSVFSHLAASDEPVHETFTRNQVKKFADMSARLTTFFDYPILRHILNSAGVVNFPEAQFEMVRLGIGLYGIGANEKEQQKLQNVSTLVTSISQIKHIEKDDSVGYGRKEMAHKNLQIATVPIGYADGLSRKLGNRKGKMLVGNLAAPIIGNVCMDMCMLDITGIPAKEGDEVIVFGEGNPITSLAKSMESIPYEVLTNVSRRVKRVYFQE